ncbi:uncharacterized protein LOC144152021 isoform X3 [Haemaphysalis longicornis]
MSDDFTVRLCKLVQGHPELYDIFNDNFHNEDAKNSAWNLISTELGVPQSKCVIKWKSLKHQFVKAKKDQNMTWDLWPALQFLDEAADKGGPRKRKSMAATTGPDNADPLDSGSRKRKRESMAAATRLDDGTDLMDSTPTKSPEKPPAKKVAARGKQAARNSPQDSTGLAGTIVANSSPQSFLAEIPYSYWSTSPVKVDASTVAPAVNEPSSASSSKLSQTKAMFGRDESAAATQSANEVVTFSQANSSSQATNTEPSGVVPTVPPQVSKPQTTGAKATPRGRRSTRFTVAETIPEEKEGATALASSQSPKKEPKAKQPSSQDTPKKASAEPVALAPTNSPVSKPQPAAKATPRGRRSMRVAIAETVVEGAQEAGPSPAEEPQAKQPRIEGNGIADNVDPLADMKFDSALDQKFFKQLQEKFTKLRPEVMSTMKASIFAMLDNAAKT